jgi:HD-like signal output (HDOD) protein
MDDAPATTRPPAARSPHAAGAGRPTIGRFQVLSVLQRSPRAVVYLAQDPLLERKVAIKAIPAAADVDREGVLASSRAAVRLRHPHVVPAFEAGEHGGHPFLVSEFIEGETLAVRVARVGTLPPAEAAMLLAQVLDALASAHDHGLVHAEIKPSNVMVAPGERALLMDLGIAQRMLDRGSGRLWTGSPAWMAPEQARGARPSAASDVYACGLLLAFMLTGRPPFEETDPASTLAIAARGKPALPPLTAEHAAAFAPVLRAALERDPQRRFDSAATMRAALASAAPAPGLDAAADDAGGAALEFLLGRMRQRTDFPALSAAISAVTQALADDSEKLSRLTDTILLDFALTHRVLRLVNSAGFAGSGAGRISTISSAVQILGFDQVRNIAVSLMLFEHMGHKAHADSLRELFIRALFAGVLARAMAPRAGVRDPEEAFVCTLFHELGRMLCVHYFPEEWNEIRARLAARRIDESLAATQVLGATLPDLAIATARRWSLPERIVHSMLPLPEGALRKPANEEELLRLVAACATDLARAAGLDRAARAEDTERIERRYRPALALEGDEGASEAFIRDCVLHLTACAAAYELDIAQTEYGRALLGLTDAGVDALRAAAALPSIGDDIPPGETLPPGASLPPTPGPPPGTTLSPPIPPAADQALVRLREGLRSAQGALFAGRAREAVMAEVLAAIQFAPGIARVLYAECDAWGNRIVGRQGAGPDSVALIPRFRSAAEGRPDVFFAALARNADVLISDATDPRIAARIPAWYRDAIAARAFLVLPLVADGQPRGLIYADGGANATLALPPPVLRLLRGLRDLATTATARD